MGYTMPYTIGQAALATGRAKMTIHRAIKSGRISASKSDTGGYAIDPAELHRVFPPVTASDDTEPSLKVRSDTDALRRENDLLRDMLRDLQRRLDREGEERRQAQTQLMALLSDQRRPWWRLKGRP